MSTFLEFVRQNRGTNLFGEGTRRAPTTEERMNMAKGEGFTEFAGGRAYRGRSAGTANWKEGRSLSSFRPPSQDPYLEQGDFLLEALGRDTDMMQGAADRQFARNNERIQALDQFRTTAPRSIAQQGQQLQQLLANFAGDAQGLGDQQHQDYQGVMDGFMDQLDGVLTPVQEFLGDMADDGVALQGQFMDIYDDAMEASQRPDVSDMVNEAIDRGDAIGDEYARNIEKVEDRTAQDASITANAIKRNAKARIMQIKAGVRADGRPMSPAEQDAAIAAVSGQVDEQVQTATGQIFSEFNKYKGQLYTQLANVRKFGVDARLQGADILNRATQTQLQGLGVAGQALQGIIANRGQLLDIKNSQGRLAMEKAGVWLGMSDQFLKSQAGVRQMTELAGNMTQVGASLNQSSLLQATRLEFDGLTATANLVRSNPESIVSYFEGLMGLFGTMAAMTGDTGAGSGGVPSFPGDDDDDIPFGDEGDNQPSQEDIDAWKERRAAERQRHQDARNRQRERNRQSTEGFNNNRRSAPEYGPSPDPRDYR